MCFVFIFVSIPFKRESVFRVAGENRIVAISPTIGFNSLQTGKCIQRDPILSPVGPWLRTPKTKREVCTPFFDPKIEVKTQ